MSQLNCILVENWRIQQSNVQQVSKQKTYENTTTCSDNHMEMTGHHRTWGNAWSGDRAWSAELLRTWTKQWVRLREHTPCFTIYTATYSWMWVWVALGLISREHFQGASVKFIIYLQNLFMCSCFAIDKIALPNIIWYQVCYIAAYTISHDHMSTTYCSYFHW